MRKINQHIEIVSSSIARLSSMSQKSRLAVLAVLSKRYSHVGITIVDNLLDLEGLVARKPDLVFLGMMFIPCNTEANQPDSDKIWLSQYLDECDIAYTGSDQRALKLEKDKSLAKQRVLKAGLDTSPFVVAQQNKPLSFNDIVPNFPVFIKPINRGGGAGIDSASLAKNFKELEAKVESISFQLKADSLIEGYLPGREFSVAILKEEFTDKYLALPLELVAPPDKNGNRLLSDTIKKADLESYASIADGELKNKITELAIKAFTALGARDYGRIDIRLDEFGTAHFIEANLIPSLIKNYGNFPKACMVNLQMDYETMLLRIVELAFVRTSSFNVQYMPLESSIVATKAVPELA